MRRPLIYVCGDPTVDWMTIRQDTEPGLGPFFWMPDKLAPGVGLSVQPGGSALITQFLKALIPADAAQVEGIELEQKYLTTPLADIQRTWTVWQQQGHDGNVSGFRIRDWTSQEGGDWDYAGNKLRGMPDLLVIEDSGLGFREKHQGWPD